MEGTTEPVCDLTGTGATGTLPVAAVAPGLAPSLDGPWPSDSRAFSDAERSPELPVPTEICDDDSIV